jgi:hypothetical protein
VPGEELAHVIAVGFAPRDALENSEAAPVVDNSPFFDLLERPKTADADEFIVQAAVPYAWGLNWGVAVRHKTNGY